MEWTVAKALEQIRTGNPLSLETESAADWLYTEIQRAVSNGQPLTAGACATMILDALIEEVKDR